MKHKTILNTVLAAAMLLLSGCGTAASSEAPANDGGTTLHGGTASVALKEPSGKVLVVYTPHDAEPMNAGIVSFMSKYPDITVEVIAGGTGELCERVAAEAANPQADVLWGGGADSLQAYADYFMSYAGSNTAAINSKFRDDKDRWIGESPLPMVIIYNKKLLAETGLKIPSSWADCLNTAFKGRIAYCQPSKSGSAYTQLCTMILANGGRDKGWEYVAKFVANLDGNILDSSGKCHKLVASGEYMIGITIEKSAALYADDPNIGFSYPSEGTSAVPDAIGIIKGCPHPDTAKLFVDFITSYQCQYEQSVDWNRRPSRGDVVNPNGLKALDKIKLVNYDFAWAAADKVEIIAQFEKLLG